jgi:hypothetical protein
MATQTESPERMYFVQRKGEGYVRLKELLQALKAEGQYDLAHRIANAYASAGRS